MTKCSQIFAPRNWLDLRTLIASEVPGSNSNLYSVSGSSFHSFFTTTALDSDVIANDQYGTVGLQLVEYIMSVLDARNAVLRFVLKGFREGTRSILN